MGRLLAVLAMTGGLVVLIVGSLGFLPGRTDASPVVGTNLACDVNLSVATRNVTQTWIINGANTYTIPAAATTDLQVFLPFDVRNQTTGAFGSGVIQQIGSSGTFNLQLHENAVVPSFPTEVTISSTLNASSLTFSGQAFDYQLGGSLLSGSASGTIRGCEDIDP
jgi:hypothetical protein